MSEDVSATMRVGITVILVAALVATVLNLMVMSNSLLSGGQTTLQSGIDSVSQQEFSTYDNTKVSGTQVSTALSLFQGRDVAVVVQTTALRKIGATGSSGSGTYKDYAINYGALLTSDGKSSSASNLASFMGPSEDKPSASQSMTVDNNIITSQARTAYLVKWHDAAPDGSHAIARNNGASNYVGYLHNTNGLVDSSYDTIGTTELGNAAYILSSARFSSILIKDATGSIIGIFFRQLT